MSKPFRLPRRLTGVALLVTGVAAGAVLTPAVGIHAQGVRAAVDALLGTAADVPDQGGLLLRAPFIILGSDGMPLLEVDEDGMTFSQRTGGLDHGFTVKNAGAPVTMMGAAGSGNGNIVALTTEGRDGAILAVGGESGAGTILLYDSSGNEAFTLGGKYKALRLLDSGQERIVVGDDKGSMGFHLRGKDGIATLGKSSSGFGLFLKDASGAETADLTQPSGKGMALRVYDGGKNVAAVGNIPGEGGSVRIFSPGAPRAAVSLYTDGSGSGRVAVYTAGSDKEAVLLDGTAGSVAVVGKGGSALLGNAEGGDPVGLGAISGGSGASWGLFLGEEGGTPTAEIAKPSGKGMALRIFDGGNQVAAVGSVPGEGGAMRVTDSGGNAAATMTFTEGGGVIQVYKSGQPVAALVGKESVVSIYNSSGTSVASMGLSSNGTGGNITTRDGSGQGVFSAGAATDGLGEACVNRTRADGGVVSACVGLGLPSMGLIR